MTRWPRGARAARRLTHINLARGFRGGERQTELLVTALAERGIDQRIVVRAGQPLAARLAAVAGLERIAIGKPFARHIPRVRGDFVHAHDGRGAHFAHAAHRLAGCDYVLTRRVDNPPSASPLTRRMYARAIAVAAVSQAIEKTLQAYQPGLATTVIPSAAAGMAANAARARALRAQFGGRYIVGHVGALDDSQKGQLDLIAAARALARRAPDWRCVLVGGGADAARLRRAAGACRAIWLTGHVDNVGDYLAAFDVFGYPSVHEGLGSALLDAMQAGLPVVASAVGGIPEIVTHRVNGLLVAARQPAALASALTTLREDPALAARLGRAGQARVRAYTAERMAARYMGWYQRLGIELAPQAAAERRGVTL